MSIDTSKQAEAKGVTLHNQEERGVVCTGQKDTDNQVVFTSRQATHNVP